MLNAEDKAKTLGGMSQKSSEGGEYVELKQTAKSDELTRLSERWRREPSKDGENVDSEEVEELINFFEREKSELDMYFDYKMQQLLRGTSSQIERDASEEELIEETLESEGEHLKDQFRLKPMRPTRKLRRGGENPGRERGTNYGENIEGTIQKGENEKQKIDLTVKNDESQLGSYFNFRLEDAERSLGTLRDEFKDIVARTGKFMMQEDGIHSAEPGGRLDKMFRESVAQKKNEAVRGKLEVAKSKKGSQLENLIARLSKTEENLESLQTELTKRKESEKDSRRLIEDIEEKLNSEYEIKLRNEILREKEEYTRVKMEMGERLRKQRHDFEERLKLQLNNAETRLTKLNAEVQQKDRMEKENRDTIIKLEGKLKEERQLRHIAERELKLKKAECSLEESLNRNENERLRNEAVGLREVIREKDKEMTNLRTIIERELHRDKERFECIDGRDILECSHEGVQGHAIVFPEEVKENIQENTRRIQDKGKVTDKDLIAIDKEGLEVKRFEFDGLRREIEEKNKEIDRLLSIKQNNELKILSLARRLEKRAKGDSKAANSIRRRHIKKVVSPELSNKTSSDDGDRQSAKNSWNHEGSLLEYEADMLNADGGNTVEERRKILIFVTFEKPDEQGILGLLNSVFPRQKVTPTIRVLLT